MTTRRDRRAGSASSRDGAGWSWLIGRGRLPTTAGGAERIVVLLIAGMRIGTLLQMAPSGARAIEVSGWPAAAAASWAVAVAASVVVAVVVLRRGTCLGPAGAAADLALAALLLVLGPFTVPIDDRIGTWVGFQPGYALSVLIASSGVRSRLVWVLGTGSIVAALLIYVGDALDDESSLTVAGNVLTFVTLAVIARGAISYIRRMAHDADEARSRAAELGRREEEQRAHVVLHNGAAVMSLLADPTIDPVVRTRLEAQARQEAQRLRTYLRGAPRQLCAPDRILLTGVVTDVAGSFPELPLELALDLGADVVLPDDDSQAVRDAVTSVLLNVRLHAGAEQVVVHLDRNEQRWTLTVHDDGSGFDPDLVDFGVGLREVVVGELGRRGIGATVHSRPGEGTTVTLNGPVPASSSRALDARSGS